MPEVTLKYSAEDENTYLAAIHGLEFWCVLWDLDQWLRLEIKHGDKDEYQPVRDQLHSFLGDRGLMLDILS